MANPAIARPVRASVTKTVIQHGDGSCTVHAKRVDRFGVVRKSTVTFKVDR